jgi:hypothetical protein
VIWASTSIRPVGTTTKAAGYPPVSILGGFDESPIATFMALTDRATVVGTSETLGTATSDRHSERRSNRPSFRGIVRSGGRLVAI